MKTRINFSELKIGDVLTRIFADTIPMKVIVGSIEKDTFKVESEDGKVPWEEGWIFNMSTGLEINEDLGWDGKTRTGSFILQEE